MIKTRFTRAQALDFVVLVLRWYLAYYMIGYGWAKLTGNQFGHRDAHIFEQPLRNITRFDLAWYLFGQSRSFNVIGAFAEIVGAALIIFNRTALIGALWLLPVLAQILAVDVAFTVDIFGMALPLRLTGMIGADFLILCYYLGRIKAAWRVLTKGLTTKFHYRWWVFLLLPLLGFLTDFVIGIIMLPTRVIIDKLLIFFRL